MAGGRIAEQDSASLGGWLFADLFVLIMVIGLAGFTINKNEPKMPKIETLAASDIRNSSATLNGVLDSGGSAAKVTFEWGDDKDLGSNPVTVDATESPIAAGKNDVDVFGILRGLKPETTYYFRAVAENKQGTSKGDVKSFRTTNVGECTSGPTFVAQPFKKKYTAKRAQKSLILDIENWLRKQEFVDPKVAVALVQGWTTDPAGSAGVDRAQGFYQSVLLRFGGEYFEKSSTALRPLQSSLLGKGQFSVELFFVDTAEACR